VCIHAFFVQSFCNENIYSRDLYKI
jgi:hypothetical protein